MVSGSLVTGSLVPGGNYQRRTIKSPDQIAVEAPYYSRQSQLITLCLLVAPCLELRHVINDHAVWVKCGHLLVVGHALAGEEKHLDSGLLVGAHAAGGELESGMKVLTDTLRGRHRWPPGGACRGQCIVDLVLGVGLVQLLDLVQCSQPA